MKPSTFRRDRWILAIIAASLFAVGAYAQEDVRTNPLPPIGGDAITEEPPLYEQISAAEPELPLPASPPVTASPDQETQEVSSMPRRFRYELKVELRGTYDDNITLSPDNRREDFYGTIAPKIILGFGDVTDRGENYVLLNYSPSAYFFLDNTEFNTIDHIARIDGQWRLSRLTLSLSQDVRSVQSANLDVAASGGGFINQVNLDIGGRQRLNTYSTHFGAAYELTGKTSLRAGLDYSLGDYQDLIGSEIFSGTLGLDYKYGPKLGFGLDFTAGKNFVDPPNPNQTFEQVNLRSNYELTGKLKATGSVGVESRQSDNGGQNQLSPVFQIGVVYQPFDGTEINLSATGQTLNSATLTGQDFTSTQFVFTVRQRLLQRLFLSLTAGYQNQTYFSTIEGLGSEREDNYHFIAPGFDVKITNFLSTGVYYFHRENNSSFTNFSFDDNQFGGRISLTF